LNRLWDNNKRAKIFAIVRYDLAECLHARYGGARFPETEVVSHQYPAIPEANAL
jgi:hypothetical protein